MDWLGLLQAAVTLFERFGEWLLRDLGRAAAVVVGAAALYFLLRLFLKVLWVVLTVLLILALALGIWWYLEERVPLEGERIEAAPLAHTRS